MVQNPKGRTSSKVYDWLALLPIIMSTHQFEVDSTGLATILLKVVGFY
jgi:hypothetical protein